MGGMRRHRLSENDKVIVFMLIIPILWPFIPLVLLCMLLEPIGEKIRQKYWGWRIRKAEAKRAKENG
jgi:hypothetical protein